MHEFRALMITDPDGARKKILAALRETRMHKGRAAVLLKVSHRNFLLWIAALSLEAAVEALAEKARREGWFHEGFRRGGRPAGTTVAQGAAPWASKTAKTPKARAARRRRREAAGGRQPGLAKEEGG